MRVVLASILISSLILAGRCDKDENVEAGDSSVPESPSPQNEKDVRQGRSTGNQGSGNPDGYEKTGDVDEHGE